MDEETNSIHALDGSRAVIGGLVAEKKIKYTKNDKVMAFLQVEDLVGTVEVIVFPKVYEQYGNKLTEEGKVFIKGRVSAEEDRDGKLICESVQTFEEVPKKLWLKFPTMEAYEQAWPALSDLLEDSDGRDSVVIYVENPRCMKQLPPSRNVAADKALLEELGKRYGAENVKLM